MSKKQNVEGKDVLQVVAETEILEHKIKLYGSIESPWFLGKDVAAWIDYSKRANGNFQVSRMLNSVDDHEKGVKSFNSLGGVQQAWFLTEDGLYECCMRSTKPIAKQMKKQIKEYLHNIRLTGGAVKMGEEEKFIRTYFSGFTDDLKTEMFVQLQESNKKLQERNTELEAHYDQFMNTDGLYSMNKVAKELKIGEYTLFKFCRDEKIMFKDSSDTNIPYERFCKEGKFEVREIKCSDGKMRAVPQVTRKGMEYLRKRLTKAGYYDGAVLPAR